MDTGTYEQIRDHTPVVPSGIREEWIRADQKARRLREDYERIQEEGDLTPEAKARRAQEIYERSREPIEAARKGVRESLLKSAKSAEYFSFPRPKDESLTTSDPTKLLLDQNEAARIVRTIERRKAQGGPFKQDTGEFLREEYRRGLEIGGPEGGAVCRGVLRAARELGAGDEWVDALRQDRHRESFDRARRLEHYSMIVPSEAPKPPKSLAKAAKGDRTRADLKPMFRPVGGPPMAAGQQPHGGRGSAKRKKK